MVLRPTIFSDGTIPLVTGDWSNDGHLTPAEPVKVFSWDFKLGTSQSGRRLLAVESGQ